MTIILKTIDAPVQAPGHLIGVGETASEAAIRVASGRDLAGNVTRRMAPSDGIFVIVATSDPLVFEIEPICDAARHPVYDGDGELLSESYAIDCHPHAVALA